MNVLDCAPSARIPPLRESLRTGRQAAIAAFEATGRPDKLLGQLRRIIDEALIQAWKAAGLPSAWALVAVGGYGRGEQYPHSDVDILILLHEPPSPEQQARLEKLVQMFWDIGLEIGHSIRTIDECLRESAADITVQTALLESRLITGSRKLFHRLEKHCRAAMDPQAFFQAKVLELRQRHAKYEDTPYSLEPNCKESPGGLRDLQVILWVAKAAGLGDSWRKLAERGLLTPTEARQISEKERVFKIVRIRLHLHAGRREDRLLFDLQTPIAEQFGFRTTETRRASEYLMQHYYWAAKAVTQLNTILLQNIQSQLFPQPAVARPINERFNEVNGLIDIAHDEVFTREPSAMLEIFLLLSRHEALRGMTARSQRELWHARFGIDESFRRNPANKALFLQILQAPRGVIHSLRHMNQLSILGRYLPNFRRIVGQMQHDLFHVYTVDQHTLMVVRNLRRFTMSEHAHEYPFCSRLIADFSKPWLLYVAALFHDIAKGRGGDHSLLGMKDAEQFCKSHGLSKEDTDLVVFLVEQHLAMSHVAQKQDLSDPDVIRAFADLVKDERHLTALYLLTVADIRGTSPKVWNAWKGKLLEDLYHLTLRVLAGVTPSADRELENRQYEALTTLRLYTLPEGAHQQLWKQLDMAYFLRHEASDIAWQTRVLYNQLNSAKPVVKCRAAPIGEGVQVVVYVKDQPDLFARICSYFANKNFSILDAKIHTTRHGYALDTFLVAEPTFASSYRDIFALIEHELSRLLEEQAPPSPPTRGRLSRLSRTFPITPSVDLRPDERGQYYLLSISANDRNGLLYDIACVLGKYGINLHTAKVMTLGERVEDVFLVDGNALSNERTQIELEKNLLNALQI
jgi:[protein-PII] uridylyltransferase